VRVRYDIQEIGRPAITQMLEEFTQAHKPALAGAGR